MAATQVKRSVHQAQPHSRRAFPKKQIAPGGRLFTFPRIKGKIVESVEFSSRPDYHSLSISFQDKTCLHLSFDTSFTVEPSYSDWKSGNQRLIREGRSIRSS